MSHSLKQPRTTYGTVKFLHECHTCVVQIGGETIPCSSPQDLWNLLARHKAPLPKEETAKPAATAIESTELFLSRGGIIIKATETFSRPPTDKLTVNRGTRKGSRAKPTKAFLEALSILEDIDLTEEFTS